MNTNKQTFLLSFLLLITLSLTAGAVYLGQHHAARVDQAVKTAHAQRDSAVKEATVKEKSLSLASKQLQDVQAQKAVLCTQLKTLKATNAICQ